MLVLLLSCVVIFTCSINVVVLEYMIKLDSEVANTMTFCQFAFLCLVLYITYGKFGTKKPEVPVKEYSQMILFFFVTNLTNNFVFHFHIDLPLHMIFRSGSLIANMILGVIIMRKTYPLYKYLSVIMVTMGIFLATAASAKIGDTSQTFNHSSDDTTGYQISQRYFDWILGICLLTLALFLSAFLGIAQEQFTTKHGKHSDEATYFSHLIPLPCFLLLSPQIVTKFQSISESTIVFNVLGLFSVPQMYVLLLLNAVTFYASIRSVFKLISEAQSLTVTLVVSIRKFLSLIFSIFYFKNEFTSQHWFATLLVFTGSILFTGIHSNIINWLLTKQDAIPDEKKDVAHSFQNQNETKLVTNKDISKYIRKQVNNKESD